MSNITPFDFNGNEVRTLTVNNEPWFVLADVCNVLELDNSARVKNRLDVLDVTNSKVENTRGQMVQTNIINESGLYDVILDSRKPQAREFRHWVTSDALPSIRKTGQYSNAEALALPQNYGEALRALADEYDQHQVTKAERDQAVEDRDTAKELAQALATPAAAWDNIANADGLIYVNDAAKMLKVGPNKLREILRSRMVLQRAPWCKNRPYQTYIDRGLLSEKIEHVPNVYGNIKINTVTFVTPKGMEWLVKKGSEGWFDKIKNKTA